MNRVFSSLVLSFILLGAAALPACTATALDDEACSATCPDADEALDGLDVNPPGVHSEGIVVPQSPRNRGGAAAAIDGGAE